MLKINVILGSSRKTALGKNLFNYLKTNKSSYEELTNATFNFIEISQYELPFFYEEIPPLENKQRVVPSNQQQWLDDMQDADGYIFLTPEYNHSMPAVLKNAVDYLADQISDKAVLTMSYSNNGRGGQFGGLALNDVLTRLNAFLLPQIVSVGNVQKKFNTDGTIKSDAPAKERTMQKLETAMKKIVFYSDLFKNNKFKI